MPSSSDTAERSDHHGKHKEKHKHKHKHKSHSKSPHRRHKSNSSRSSSRENSREREKRREKDREKHRNDKHREREKNREKDPVPPKPIPVPEPEPIPPIEPEPTPPVDPEPEPQPNPDPLPIPEPDGNGPFAGPDPESEGENDFNPENAAKSLNKALKGFGTDEKRVIKELTKHTNEQIQAIKDKYLTMYGKLLKEDLKSDLSFRFKDVAIALLEPRDQYEVHKLRNAIHGAGTDEKCIIDILCTKNGFEIIKLKEAYKKMYNIDLDNDLVNEETGHIGKFFRSLATGLRPDSTDVDTELAKKEAQEIYQAGEGQFGTDESEICRILASRSNEQLKETFKYYSEISNKNIVEAIKSETSGKFQDALIAIIQSILNRPAYFAKRIQESMKGIGTNDDDLIRILVTRSEIDMEQIRNEYIRIFNKNLLERLEKDLSGDYKKIMLKLASR